MTTLTATVTRSIEDAAQEGIAGYTYSRARVVIDHEYLRNVLLQASASVQYANYLPAGGHAGSLSLGGTLGVIAVIIKQEILLFFVGGIFVIEALSVILQVSSFKLRSKRIFRMAPIHHHFELLGWSESKVIVRFWILALVFALFALTTLKLR